MIFHLFIYVFMYQVIPQIKTHTHIKKNTQKTTRKKNTTCTLSFFHSIKNDIYWTYRRKKKGGEVIHSQSCSVNKYASIYYIFIRFIVFIRFILFQCFGKKKIHKNNSLEKQNCQRKILHPHRKKKVSVVRLLKILAMNVALL